MSTNTQSSETVSARLKLEAEIADFLLLQTVNRCEPLFAHFARRATLHPLHFYEEALQLAGDLGTFRDARR